MTNKSWEELEHKIVALENRVKRLCGCALGDACSKADVTNLKCKYFPGFGELFLLRKELLHFRRATIEQQDVCQGSVKC